MSHLNSALTPSIAAKYWWKYLKLVERKMLPIWKWKCRSFDVTELLNGIDSKMCTLTPPKNKRHTEVYSIFWIFSVLYIAVRHPFLVRLHSLNQITFVSLSTSAAVDAPYHIIPQINCLGWSEAVWQQCKAPSVTLFFIGVPSFRWLKYILHSCIGLQDRIY